jgi:hypothetical protein
VNVTKKPGVLGACGTCGFLRPLTAKIPDFWAPLGVCKVKNAQNCAFALSFGLKPHRLLVPAVFAVWLVSCGLEEYSYISAVPQGNITVVLNNTATIQLPGSNPGNAFINFSILYRIYVSAQNESGQIQTSSSALSAINSSLASDYAAIYPSTDVTSNTTNTNVGGTFKSRGYYEIALEGTNIRTLLDSGSLGKTIVIDFPPIVGSIPGITFDGTANYNLYRSRGEDYIQTDANRSLPEDRYLQNHADLYAGSNSTGKTNMDVAGSSTSTSYTYISLYIVATGKDKMTTIFSRPTFIGIFKLPMKY